ncbi:NAD(P)H-binding protein [Nocardia sp. NPDC050406]|uniref:NAD(P)H-binding protein n=1 Tax=Nocardia sp. NPDC050406 TaxID=3364318 RepID=UPI0037966FD4
MILVTGATGTVGRALVDQLVTAGAPVRALTRRPATAALPDAVDVVAGDLNDRASIAAALAGVDRVFLLSTGPQIPVHDANLLHEATRAEVTHVVKLSSARTADATATDPIPTWHRHGEESLRASGLDWTILAPLGFMANALHWANTIRDQNTVYAPYASGRIAAIDENDIAAVAATVLTTPGHHSQTYLLSGPEPLTPADMTATLADTLAKPLRFVEVDPATAHRTLLSHGVPPRMADAIMALRATATESFTSAIHPTVRELTGTAPNTFRQWATRHLADFG